MRLSCLIRRAAEEHAHVVAFDVDGTILSYDGDHTKFGEPLPGIIDELKKLRDANWKIAIWTCRSDLAAVKAALDERGVPYDFINENPLGPKDTSGKIFAECYVDDRSVDFNGQTAGLSDRIMAFQPWYKAQ